MCRVAVIALVAAGCYRPEPRPGAPCPTGECPVGERCVAGTCRDDGDLGPADGPTSNTDLDAPIDPPRAWSAPVRIPGVNSSAAESDPSLTADRLTIVFTSDRAGGLGGQDLYLGTRTTTIDAFTVAPLTALNSTTRDSSPEISADGNTIYFTSDRGGNLDVYVATRGAASWSTPLPVTELNSTASESDVAISPDGLTALLSRSNDVYSATRPSIVAPFDTPVLVPILDVTGDVAAPSLTNGAASVYLHGRTVRDLYVAYRQGATFTTPVPIAELNTAMRDAAPFISADGAHLVFERAGELYETSR